MNTTIEPQPVPAVEQRDFQARRWLSPALLLSLLAVLGGLLLLGIIPRVGHVNQLGETLAAQTPAFRVAVASPGNEAAGFALPSSVEAVQETPIYSRVNGYVKRIATDIGAKVNAGDLLAEIETPELDQQVNQAKAALEQAEANLVLAATTYSRWQELQKNRVVAAQDVDERKGALDARRADRSAAAANLERLIRMQGFQRISAPFSGTVTQRFVEVGQLVAGDLNDPARILLRNARTDALRAFINVPQSDYRDISVGQTVALGFREVPGRTFPGTVVRTAGALDPATRTLRTEVQVANETGELIPGLYAEVRFQVRREHPPVTVPARALILRSAGPQIATVDGENRVTLRSVAIGRDFGKTIEIISGVEPGARIIVNPTDTLRDGAIIRVEAAVAPKLAAK
jgi:RND family efflux transporter MFP subunit